MTSARIELAKLVDDAARDPRTRVSDRANVALAHSDECAGKIHRFAIYREADLVGPVLTRRVASNWSLIRGNTDQKTQEALHESRRHHRRRAENPGRPPP